MILWWTYQQLRASSPQTRLAVIAKLAESEALDSIEPLLFALKDKEPEVRNAAMVALGKIQDKRVMEPLLQRLRDPVPTVRAAAAEILGKRGDYQAVTAQIQSGSEALYIVDNRTGLLAVFVYDPQSRALQAKAVRPLADAFR